MVKTLKVTPKWQARGKEGGRSTKRNLVRTTYQVTTILIFYKRRGKKMKRVKIWGIPQQKGKEKITWT